jgi:hypothetical protein
MASAQRFVSVFLGLAVVILLAAGTVHAEGRVYPTPQAVKPLAPGATVPAARVETVRGEPVDLAKKVRDDGALLVFYRGGW